MNTSKLAAALFAAVLIISISAACSKKPAAQSNSLVDYYTCTMHPSVHSKDPGKCPICGMDLVPVMKKSAQNSAPSAASPSVPETNEFSVPVERQQQIGVTYTTVEPRSLSRTIRAVGSVFADRKKTWSFVSRVDGYVQELFVASPGEVVEKDAPLLSIYSPDLLTAEQEFLMLGSHHDGKPNETTDRLKDAAKLRLLQWNVTEAQIADLEKSGRPSPTFTLRSPFRGIVTKVAASQGASIKTGDAMVEVIDLSKVWVWVEFYEADLALLKPGQTVGVTSISYPGRTFDGTIALIDPLIDPERHTVRVRLDVENPQFLLRPGLYVNAELRLDAGTSLAVSVDAVKPTGLRNLVFVDRGGGKLEPRYVTLGGRFGNFYAVQKGLVAGERVVSSANFLIDAESKVQGAMKDFDSTEEAQ